MVDGPRSGADSIAEHAVGWRAMGVVGEVQSLRMKGVFAITSGFPYTYLLTTGLMLAGVTAATGWIVFLVRTFRRRWAARATTVTIR
jgi:hypothetical protein